MPARVRCAAAIAVAVMAVAPSARAADGSLEINQTCATQTGCFVGDFAGFPVTITDLAPAKSFRLTSDLVVATVDETAISVRTDAARVDLGGFAVRGPVSCSGAPTSCTSIGTGSGVAVDASSREAVEVRNGVVTGMGQFGVALGTRGVVESVRADQNAATGIRGFAGTAVRGCTASANGGGILVGPGGLISGSVALDNVFQGFVGSGQGTTLIGNTARGNGAVGISAGESAVVKDNASSSNLDDGITADSGSTVYGNAVQQNAGEGLVCTNRCNVSGNSVTGNGDAADEDGIQCGAGCAVRANTANGNRGFGLNLGGDAAYGENVLVSNVTGPVTGGVNRGDNHCAGIGTVSATCP